MGEPSETRASIDDVRSALQRVASQHTQGMHAAAADGDSSAESCLGRQLNDELATELERLGWTLADLVSHLADERKSDGSCSAAISNGKV